MRALRPGFLTMVGDEIWVLDAVQPVGVILDKESGAVRATRTWPQLPRSVKPDDGDPDHHWHVAGADDALWVQQLTGPLARVDRDGSVTGHVSGDLHLAAVSEHGAWCVPAKPVHGLAMNPDKLRRTATEQWSWLHLVRPDGELHQVAVNTPAVHAAHTDEGSLLLLVESGPGQVARASGMWQWQPETQWLRIPAPLAVPPSVLVADFAVGPPPRAAASTINGGRLYTRWLNVDKTAISGDYPLEPAGGRWWAVGRPAPGATSLLACEVDSAGGAVTRAVDLGEGHPRAVLGGPHHLWVAIEEPHTDFRRSAPARLVRIDTTTGVVETILAADTLDISGLGWARGTSGGGADRPIDTDSYLRYWRSRFAGLDDCWIAQDGSRRPLSDGLRNTRAAVVGDWPDAMIEVTFDFDERPGLRLRRMIPLFDELGRQLPPTNLDINIMADLDTGRVPPADQARDGVLDF